ncbi:hypothetical protein SKTS_32900 [Sulfurimicrobium lacus]|uniref:Lipoprotein n=1 Tax=Sulfurimicrobium lacus TaxID=2715678 RepID=A0A6F8VFF0_9PROT|nr:hypothetical protein [Sulfurimicrobium lacus]BCB28404.1 hypothetical protein SKTS_32900 [Sulfurimicrobium lacus]
MRVFALIALVAITGCGCADKEPVTEVPSQFCDSKLTGKTGKRTWSECVQIGKNTCGSTVKKSRATEQLETICRFVTWRDQK